MSVNTGWSVYVSEILFRRRKSFELLEVPGNNLEVGTVSIGREGKSGTVDLKV